MNMNSVGRLLRWRGAVVVLGAFVLGGVIMPNVHFSWHLSWRVPESAADVAGLNVRPAPPQQALAPEEAYARAAQAAYKSVVNIDTTQQVRLSPDMLDEFFDRGPRFGQNRTEGSGVLITPSGYILTNQHVVGEFNEPGRTILVTLTDGRKLSGRVVGADYTTDVALVKVDGKDLPAAAIGTVQGLVPGQMCVAIGNPLTLQFTVTHGVISALGRPVATQEGRLYSNLIQHDAGINPGNSGGPLVSLKGQVIGINTLVRENAQGIGFAIPIDTALKVADELKRSGRIKRPWLGLFVQPNSAFLVQRYGVPNVGGLVVTGTYPGGAAERAKVILGDVVTRVNGAKVRTEEDFKRAQSALKIGSTARLEIHRGDQYAEVRLPISEQP